MKRRRGLPTHGHVQFRTVRLKRLPAVMSIESCSIGLGVTRKTITRWIDSGMPIFGEPYHRVIRKLPLVDWLVETGRYRRRQK